MHNKSPSPIVINKPIIGEKEYLNIKKVLESGLLTSPSRGPFLREFERRVSQYLGVKHAIAVANGTTALHAALMASGISYGDEVILPSFTFVATAEAVILAGATPVFADIEPDTYTLDLNSVKKVLSPRTKAIIPVHLYGLPCNMEEILELAEHKGLIVIEDAAQAFGAEYKGKKIGGIGDLTCFSFYPSKNITCGEGGLISTNRDDLAEKVRLFISHGEAERYKSSMLGTNYRMSELHAAIGVAQMEKIEGFLEKRSENASKLTFLLKDFPWLHTPIVPEGKKHAWNLYTVKLKDRERNIRDRILKYLREKKILATVYYPTPIHLMPYYRGRFTEANLTNTCIASDSVFSLPIHPQVTEDQLEYIANILQEAYNYSRK